MLNRLTKALTGQSEVIKSNEKRRRSKHQSGGHRARRSDASKRDLATIRGTEKIPETYIEPSKGYRENLVSIIVPMGCGKSSMANKYGWIDCDNLVDDKVRSQVYEECMSNIANGASWDAGFAKLHKEMAKTLDMMQCRDTTLVLVNSYSMAKDLDLMVSGIVLLSKGQHEINIEQREDHEKVLARANRCNVENLALPNDLIPWVVSTNFEIDNYCQVVCSMLNIPTCCPGEFDIDDESYTQSGLQAARDQNYDLDQLVQMEERGDIPRECVDYHVKKHNIGAFKGYGVTMNDWAKVMAGHSRGGRGLSHRISSFDRVTVETMGDFIDLKSAGVQTILQSHPQDDKFTVNLLCHWVDIGQKTGIGNSIMQLYNVSKGSWKRFFERLASVLRLTNYFMGQPLTTSERECLMEMSMLSNVRRKTMIAAMGDKTRTYPASHRVDDMVDRAKAGLVGLTCASDSLTLDQPYPSIQVSGKNVEDVITASSTAGHDLKTALSMAVPAAIMSQYSDYPEALSTAARAQSRIATKWYRAHFVRDEWSDATNKLYDSKDWRASTVGAIALMVTNTEESLRGGYDWSSKVESVLRSLLVCGMVADQFKAMILMQRVNGKLGPRVMSDDEDNMWSYIASLRLPKHMLSDTKPDETDALTFMARLAEDQRSRTIRMMSVVNSHDWMPERCNIRCKMAVVHNWLTVIPEEMALSRKLVLQSFYNWTGHSLSDKRATSLELYVCGRVQDGGLGVPNKEHMLYKIQKMGTRDYSKHCEGNESQLAWDLHGIETRGRVVAPAYTGIVDAVRMMSGIDYSNTDEETIRHRLHATTFGVLGVSLAMMVECATMRGDISQKKVTALGCLNQMEIGGNRYRLSGLRPLETSVDKRLGQMLEDLQSAQDFEWERLTAEMERKLTAIEVASKPKYPTDKGGVEGRLYKLANKLNEVVESLEDDSG